MREILFRGKTIANNPMWVEGFYNHIPCGRFLCDEHCIQTIGKDGRIGQLFDVYDSTVGQFTGLTDKNGKKIFEGDIVRIISNDYVGFDEKGKVEFKDGCFGVSYFPEWMREYSFGDWHFHRIGEIGEWREMAASGKIYYTYELIGNIHDNPELLEGVIDNG